MRLYGKKIVGNYVDKLQSAKEETRDAILWDILSTQRLCRVKIQGSNTLVVAHYPENWEKTPVWLKKGNAVKIVHTRGVRGRIELMGHGQVIPSPVSGDTFPTPDTPPDCVLTGCNVFEVPNDPKMIVLVGVGTYRIAGMTYVLDEIEMNNDYYRMGDGGGMGQVAGALPVNAAPASGYYRYDMITVGIDGVLHYTAGTAATSDPVKPTPAVNHVLVGDHFLIPYGLTKITSKYIGMSWSTPVWSEIVMVIADNQLGPGELTTTITVTVRDQYGNPLPGTGYGWYIFLDIMAGNGYVSSAEEGESSTRIGGHTMSGSGYTFGYRRDGLITDSSPVIKATLEIDYPLETVGQIYISGVLS